MDDSRPLRVLVVDDEPLARQRLTDLLRGEGGLEVVGEAEDGDEAVRAIRGLAPDLVFLDIQMPGRTGLDVVREVGPERMPATIFVTAYDQHALSAFDVAAVDYLVKPFDDERFAQALARARERLRLREVARMTRRLLAVLGPADGAGDGAAAEGPAAASSRAQGDALQRIAVESRGTLRYVPVDAIDYVTASGPYAELHVGGQTHLVRERMQELERRLDQGRFLRIHRSAIVQLDRVDSLQRRGSGETAVKLRDGTELPVSRSRRELLERRLAAPV
jgi:two-component system, LytTR family, response regulator